MADAARPAEPCDDRTVGAGEPRDLVGGIAGDHLRRDLDDSGNAGRELRELLPGTRLPSRAAGRRGRLEPGGQLQRPENVREKGSDILEFVGLTDKATQPPSSDVARQESVGS